MSNFIEEGGATIKVMCDKHPKKCFDFTKKRNKWELKCPICKKVLFILKGYKPCIASFRNHLYWKGKGNAKSQKANCI